MFDRLKRLLGQDDPLAPHRLNDAVQDDALDQSIDAIRQTQIIDPSRSPDEFDSATSGFANKKKPKKQKDTGLRSSDPTARTPLYRPTLRPPMAFLAVLDDGSIRDSEVTRLRGGMITIGREHGDLLFPHEVLMSSRHAQLECRRHRGSYQWHFKDLNSRNGSFFRVQRALMRDGQEFLIGSHRFAFRLPLPDGTLKANGRFGVETAAVAGEPVDEDVHSTQLVGPQINPATLPRLIWKGLQGGEQVYQFASNHIVIGSDQETSALGISGDPYICRNHTKLYQGERGWVIEDIGSQNGTWLRLPEAKLDQVTEFQLGEQRFYFRPPQFNHAADEAS